MLDGADVTDSLIAPGVRVSGVVRHSVLGPGVVVEAGGEVSDSVLLGGLDRAGARVHWSVIDCSCVVEPDAGVGSPDAAALDDPDAVTLVGPRHATVHGYITPLAAGWSRARPATVASMTLSCPVRPHRRRLHAV